MHPSKYGENWCSLGWNDLNNGSLGRIIIRKKVTNASNTWPNFLLTVSGDRRNHYDTWLWHCLVPHAHRNIPKASIESHCCVDFSPWLATKVPCNNLNAAGGRQKFFKHFLLLARLRSTHWRPVISSKGKFPYFTSHPLELDHACAAKAPMAAPMSH
jgi:hypothetical protein